MEVINCRYCGEDYTPSKSGTCVLTVVDDYSSKQKYATLCEGCNKYTLTSVDDVPHKVWDDFWERNGPYFVASRGCGCSKHSTERMISPDLFFREKGFRSFYAYCPVCNEEIYIPSRAIPKNVRDDINPTVTCCHNVGVSCCTVL